MNNTVTNLIGSTKQLYNDIDACIGNIISARLKHSYEDEGAALFKMESLMVDTLQQFDCILNVLSKNTFQSIENWLVRTFDVDGLDMLAFTNLLQEHGLFIPDDWVQTKIDL